MKFSGDASISKGFISCEVDVNKRLIKIKFVMFYLYICMYGGKRA